MWCYRYVHIVFAVLGLGEQRLQVQTDWFLLNFSRTTSVAMLIINIFYFHSILQWSRLFLEKLHKQHYEVPLHILYIRFPQNRPNVIIETPMNDRRIVLSVLLLMFSLWCSTCAFFLPQLYNTYVCYHLIDCEGSPARRSLSQVLLTPYWFEEGAIREWDQPCAADIVWAVFVIIK